MKHSNVSDDADELSSLGMFDFTEVNFSCETYVKKLRVFHDVDEYNSAEVKM